MLRSSAPDDETITVGELVDELLSPLRTTSRLTGPNPGDASSVRAQPLTWYACLHAGGTALKPPLSSPPTFARIPPLPRTGHRLTQTEQPTLAS
jgi:hypothetical protein